MALPQSLPRRTQVLQLVFSWRVRIDLGELAAEFADGEELMALSEAYVAWETELKEKSREEGEQRKALMIALSLLKQGIPLDVIAQATSLSISQIQQLQAENP
jgi:predicted transposase/invertase (TIGR01784 family)